MRKIEDRFQDLADQIIAWEKMPPFGNHAGVVTQFYALWRARHLSRQKKEEDMKIASDLTGKPLTKEEEEILERKGYVFSRGKTIPSHIAAGFQIPLMVDHHSHYLGELEWRLLKAEIGDFLVPDFTNLLFVPLSPHLMLTASANSATLSASSVAALNQTILASSCNYCFARSIDLSFGALVRAHLAAESTASIAMRTTSTNSIIRMHNRFSI